MVICRQCGRISPHDEECRCRIKEMAREVVARAFNGLDATYPVRLNQKDTPMQVTDERVEAGLAGWFRSIDWHTQGPKLMGERVAALAREKMCAALEAALSIKDKPPEGACPTCFGSGKTVRPQIPETCGKCGGSGKV